MDLRQSPAEATALQLPIQPFGIGPRLLPPLSTTVLTFSVLTTPFEERIHETDSGTTKAATAP